MNLTLFKSLHLVVAATVTAVFLFWHSSAGCSMGRGAGSNDGFLLWSGWIALALYLVVVAYTLRKYLHRFRRSPEFKLRVPLDKLEATERRLNDLRRKILSGTYTEKADILEKGNAILRSEGAHKIMRLEVRPGGPGEPELVLDARPTEPLFRVAKWLHAHLYYGLAAAVIVWLHGGGNFSSPMGFLLNVLSYLVIVTGVVGIALWTFGPAWMTSKEVDLSVEEAFALDENLSRKIDVELAKLDDQPAVKAVFQDVARRDQNFTDSARKALDGLVRQQPDSAESFRDLMALLGQHNRVKRGRASMARVKFWMNVWRVVHIPLSILLLGLLVVHVWSVWRY